MSEIIFRLKYAFYLWRHVPSLGLWAALRYPMDSATFIGNTPEELAASEISYMHE